MTKEQFKDRINRVGIKDETDLRETVICNDRAYEVPIDVANELKRLRELEESCRDLYNRISELWESIKGLFSK